MVNLREMIEQELNKILENTPGSKKPPQVTNKILPDSDTESKIYGGSTLDLDVVGKPNNPKKLGTRDVYKSARDKQSKENLSEGLQYHLKNKITFDDNVYRPGTRKFFNLMNEARSLWESGNYSATPEEYELFTSDIGRWGVYEGKRVPLDFPMWDEDLNESFADHYDDHYSTWIDLDHKELKKHPEIYDEIYKLIDMSYANVGGHSNYKSADDIADDYAISNFALIDVDDDREVDAARLSRQTRNGKKAVASASDGTKLAKDYLKSKIEKDLKTPGHYAEVSDAAAGFAFKIGAKTISDEETARKIIRKKIEWHGEHPEGLFPKTYGWYTRMIGGEPHTKIIVGSPNLDEAKYKGREVKLGTAGASQSGGRAHVYVRNPKTGKIKKVSFGSGMPDAMGDSPKHRARRRSFGARHGCSKNKNKLSASYWACRATKMFGRKVAGWW